MPRIVEEWGNSTDGARQICVREIGQDHFEAETFEAPWGHNGAHCTVRLTTEFGEIPLVVGYRGYLEISAR